MFCRKTRYISGSLLLFVWLFVACLCEVCLLSVPCISRSICEKKWVYFPNSVCVSDTRSVSDKVCVSQRRTVLGESPRDCCASLKGSCDGSSLLLGAAAGALVGGFVAHQIAKRKYDVLGPEYPEILEKRQLCVRSLRRKRRQHRLKRLYRRQCERDLEDLCEEKSRLQNMIDIKRDEVARLENQALDLQKRKSGISDTSLCFDEIEAVIRDCRKRISEHRLELIGICRLVNSLESILSELGGFEF